MHESATLQNGLARKLIGVSRSLKPNKMLAGIAALFAVALLAVIAPAVVFAAAPAVPGWPDEGAVTSGDGTMTLNWLNANNATGYEFRYADNTFAFFLDPVPPTWHEASTSWNDTNYTVPKDTLTVGTTYYFQVRAVNANDDPITYSDPSSTENGIQRAAPAKLTNVQATAGDAEVTLGWDIPPEGDLVISYDYRQSDPNNPATEHSWVTLPLVDSSYKVTRLTNGVPYTFEVRALNSQGPGPGSDPAYATPAGPPEAPADLAAKAGDTQVGLTWTDPDDSSITKYQYRHSSSVNSNGNPVWEPDWTHVDDSASLTEHTYSVTGLTNGTTYTIQLRAVSDVGAGEAGEVTATPQSGETAPGVMVNVQWEVRGSTVYFTWDDPDDSSIDYYRYRYDREASDPDAWDVDWTKIPGSTGSTTTWDNSIGSDIVRFYELQAVNDPGTAEDTSDDLFGPATPVTATKTNIPETSPAAPAAPTGLMAAATATPGQVALSWTVPSGDATVTGYQYRQSIRQDDNGNAIWNPDWTDISESGSTTAAHNLTGLTDGTAYTFEVRATNNMDTTSDTTDDIHGAVASVGPVTLGAPGAPTGLAVATADETGTGDVNEAPTQTTLHLSWTAPTGISGVAIDGYEYRQRASADTEWGEWAATGGAGVTYTVSGLAAGTSYDFQVRALAGTIGGPESNTAAGATAVPAATPAAPTGLSAIGVANGVKLTWSNPSDDTINIYRYRQATAEADLSTASWEAFSNKATLTEYTVTGLTAETTYYFQILANNANGDGPGSATVSADAQAAGDGS